MKRLLLLIVLGIIPVMNIASSMPSSVAKPIAYGAAVLTWGLMAPTVAHLMNTSPLCLNIGEALLGGRIGHRILLAGLLAGTVGTLAAVKVYMLITSQ